jgi:anti-sigma factor RsiW
MSRSYCARQKLRGTWPNGPTMMPSGPDGDEVGAPEQLAGYADGELGPATREAVERGLLGDPRARADVEAQRRLARLWQATAPADPGEDAWSGVLARIEASLPAVRLARPGRRRWPARAALAALRAGPHNRERPQATPPVSP